MNRIFKKKEILTIPNLLSAFRLALIPLIVWLYCGAQNYLLASGAIVFSGITDIIDGFIARRFNMTSDFGKILDPIADKLTQAALLICLLFKFKLMRWLVLLFVICEIGKLSLGAITYKKRNVINSAKWYGKVNTVIIYSVATALILFSSMSESVANTLIMLCAVVMIISHILYSCFYYKALRNKKINKLEDNI